jgi:hypothetical protein
MADYLQGVQLKYRHVLTSNACCFYEREESEESNMLLFY